MTRYDRFVIHEVESGWMRGLTIGLIVADGDGGHVCVHVCMRGEMDGMDG